MGLLAQVQGMMNGDRGEAAELGRLWARVDDWSVRNGGAKEETVAAIVDVRADPVLGGTLERSPKALAWAMERLDGPLLEDADRTGDGSAVLNRLRYDVELQRVAGDSLSGASRYGMEASPELTRLVGEKAAWKVVEAIHAMDGVSCRKLADGSMTGMRKEVTDRLAGPIPRLDREGPAADRLSPREAARGPRELTRLAPGRASAWER